MTVLKIQATHLRDAIRPVAALAAKDPGAPALLTKVRLWTGDGTLYASCTDKLVAGIERTIVTGAEPGFDTCVDVNDLGNHLDLVAPRGTGYNPRLILEATPGGLVVQAEPYDTDQPSATFHLQAVDPGLFPKVVDMIAKLPDPIDEPALDVALYAHILGRFTPAQRDEPLRIRFTGRRTAALVSGADSFLGVMMPALMRPGSAPNLWPELFGGDES